MSIPSSQNRLHFAYRYYRFAAALAAGGSAPDS
jgi:hypothetical protein